MSKQHEQDAWGLLDDDSCREPVSEALARMKDFFTTVVNEIPITSGFETVDEQVVMDAVSGLGAIASCRRQIEAGRAVSAAWCMYKAALLCRGINMIANEEVHAPVMKAGQAAKDGRSAGLGTIGEHRRRERDNRVADYRKWRAQKVKKAQIPREAASEWGIKLKTARRWLNDHTDFKTDS